MHCTEVCDDLVYAVRLDEGEEWSTGRPRRCPHERAIRLRCEPAVGTVNSNSKRLSVPLGP